MSEEEKLLKTVRDAETQLANMMDTGVYPPGLDLPRVKFMLDLVRGIRRQMETDQLPPPPRQSVVGAYLLDGAWSRDWEITRLLWEVDHRHERYGKAR